MDSWQILYSAIGGFIGFGFAIFLEFLVSKKRGKDDRVKAKENLLDELKGIKKLISGNEKTEGIIHFDTPIWDAVVSTGNILAMLKDDKEFYKKLLIIYGKLSGHKKMEENFSEYYEQIIGLRKEIVNKIDSIIANNTNEVTHE